MNSVPPMSAADLAGATGDYAAIGRPEPMTADRFRELCADIGLSVRDLAAALSMTGRHADVHLREMLDGVRKVPGPTGIAAMALADGWRPGAWPDPHVIDEMIDQCSVNSISECHGWIFEDCAAMLRRLTGRGA